MLRIDDHRGRFQPRDFRCVHSLAHRRRLPKYCLSCFSANEKRPEQFTCAGQIVKLDEGFRALFLDALFVEIFLRARMHRHRHSGQRALELDVLGRRMSGCEVRQAFVDRLRHLVDLVVGHARMRHQVIHHGGGRNRRRLALIGVGRDADLHVRRADLVDDEAGISTTVMGTELARSRIDDTPRPADCRVASSWRFFISSTDSPKGRYSTLPRSL